MHATYSAISIFLQLNKHKIKFLFLFGFQWRFNLVGCQIQNLRQYIVSQPSHQTHRVVGSF